MSGRWCRCSCLLLGEMGMAQLIDPALVPAAAEGGGEKGLDAGLGHLDPDEPRADGDDVGVVMLAGETRRERLGNERGAAGRVAVGGDRYADARAAQGDAEIGAAGGDLLGELVA